MGGVSASIGLGAALLCAGVLVYLVYCRLMDKKEDASAAAAATEPEEGFSFQTWVVFSGQPVSGMWLYSA